MSTLLPIDKLAEDLKHKHEHDTVWGSDVGKDCITLCDSLAEWLTKRLIHLSIYGNTHPGNLSPKEWELKLRFAATSLYQYTLLRNNQVEVCPFEFDDVQDNAKKAIHWVADNFEHLWD